MRWLLDLFCGAGMASDGYQAAGFDKIVGVDINPQPDYPYEFWQADAISWLENNSVESFAAIHASPPCQMHTRAKHLRKAQGGESKYPDLLTPTLELLRNIDIPWVAENVPGAPGMEDAVVECGSSYGLGVRRHRMFKSNIPLVGSVCDHKAQGRPWGVYHVMNDQVPQGGRTVRTLGQGWEVMGVNREIPWKSLKEGFPPAYTRHIGSQILSWLDNAERAS